MDSNRSVWGSTTPGDIKKIYGKAYHPFAENGEFGQSAYLADSSGMHTRDELTCG